MIFCSTCVLFLVNQITRTKCVFLLVGFGEFEEEEEKERERFWEHNFDIFFMGNKLGRRKQVVDEKYTRPQGLYVHKDVDIKKLRKLILDSKLAPCYPGDEECGCDLEECPICFLVCIYFF